MGPGDGRDPRDQREGPGQADGLSLRGGLIYLSSFRMGDRLDTLVASLPVGGRVAVVSNAADLIPDESRRSYARNVFDPLAAFAAHGLEASDLDLRDFFGSPDALAERLNGVDLVWANGGNTFLLMRAIHASGLDAILRQGLADRRLSYGGWSAGACVAGPTLRGLEAMDDPDEIAAGYPQETVWEGMGLINFAVVPHFNPESADWLAAQAVQRALQDAGVAHRTLSDGEALVVDRQDEPAP